MFPDLDTDAAVEKLWQLIFDVCRVTGGAIYPMIVYRYAVAGKYFANNALSSLIFSGLLI